MSDELYNLLEQYTNSYKSVLAKQYKQPTVTKHIMVCSMFNDYLFEKGIDKFENITPAHYSSGFNRFFNANTHEGLTNTTTKNILKKFFVYLRYDTAIQ